MRQPCHIQETTQQVTIHSISARNGICEVRSALTVRCIYPVAKQTSVRRIYLRPDVTGLASCSKQRSPWRCKSALPAFGTILATTLPLGPVQQAAVVYGCKAARDDMQCCVNRTCFLEVYCMALLPHNVYMDLEASCTLSTTLGVRNGCCMLWRTG